MSPSGSQDDGWKELERRRGRMDRTEKSGSGIASYSLLRPAVNKGVWDSTTRGTACWVMLSSASVGRVGHHSAEGWCGRQGILSSCSPPL